MKIAIFKILQELFQEQKCNVTVTVVFAYHLEQILMLSVLFSLFSTASLLGDTFNITVTGFLCHPLNFLLSVGILHTVILYTVRF